VGKIAEELEQTSPDHPNVVCISFFGAAPSPPAIRLAFADLLSEEKKLGEGLDFSKLERVPAILEFSRSKFLKAHINPRVSEPSRLSEQDLQELVSQVRLSCMDRDAVHWREVSAEEVVDHLDEHCAARCHHVEAQMASRTCV
jgi:hypothetical protein